MKSKYIVALITLLCSIQGIGQSYNTATGTGALGSVTTGGANTATGAYSSPNLTTPWNNTSHGYSSLNGLATGSNNAAFGSKASYWLWDGENNTALGYRSLYTNYRGSRSTGTGVEALYNSGADNNTAVGYRASFSNTYGTLNTAVGAFAGWNNVSGSRNTFIGSGTDFYSTSQNLSNATFIGTSSTAASTDYSNKITVGNVYTVYITGQVSWTTISDKRAKRNITENVPGLSFIKLLRPVTYHLDVQAIKAFQIPQNDTQRNNIPPTFFPPEADQRVENKLFTGFIAQEVSDAAKSIQYEFSGVQAPKDDAGLFTVRYEEFVVPLVKTVQELSAGKQSLEKEAADLTKQLQLLQTNIATLKLRQAQCCPASSK